MSDRELSAFGYQTLFLGAALLWVGYRFLRRPSETSEAAERWGQRWRRRPVWLPKADPAATKWAMRPMGVLFAAIGAGLLYVAARALWVGGL